MDFLEKINSALTYIENNLTEEIQLDRVAKEAGCSEYHFSRMFSFLAGQSLSLYIRRRRLSLAAVELNSHENSLLEVAVKYGYSSVDSFTRAFKEVHGILPSHLKKEPKSIKVYPRISFNLNIKGGQEMIYRVVKKESFRIVGIKKRVNLIFQGNNPEIDLMWQSLKPEQIRRWKSLSNIEPRGIISASVNFSEDRMTGSGSLDYYIGAATDRTPEDEEAILYVDESLWAVFESVGKFPETLQNIWGRIYSEWFPSVPYQLSPGPEILWNEKPDTSDPQFKSEIWIPIQGKND